MPKVVSLTEHPKGAAYSELRWKVTEARAEKAEVKSFLKSQRLKHVLE